VVIIMMNERNKNMEILKEDGMQERCKEKINLKNVW
jgi:hypothetical protein